jgi:hypothetical protein
MEKAIRIKLNDNIVDAFVESNKLRHEAERILKRACDATQTLFDELKKIYPEYSHIGAKIDHRSNELILPFGKLVGTEETDEGE